MAPKSVVSFILALLVVFAIVSTAVAGVELPGPIAKELTLFPGAKVLNGNSLPGGNHVAMVNFGKSPIPEVYNYYKDKLIENGFTIQTEVMGTSIIAKKGNLDAVVDLDTKNGETVGTLSISGENDGPAAPPAPPTPPASPAPSASIEEPSISMAGPGGGAKYPAEIAAIVKQYPGSMIMSSRQMADKGASVLLAIKNSSMADVVAFYKAEITKGGWNKEDEVNNQGNTILGYKKDGQELMAVIRDAGEALIVTLTFEK